MEDDVCAKLLQILCGTWENNVFMTQALGLWFQARLRIAVADAGSASFTFLASGEICREDIMM